MSSEGYHEPVEVLSEDTRNLHRAIISLIEELEAVDWYNQRAHACTDPELQAVLEHNRDEEIEHAMMTLEWLRRRLPQLDAQARTYLFTEGPITAIEGGEDGDGASPDRPHSRQSLGIGSLAHGRGSETE